MKRILLLAALLLVSVQAWPATRTISDAGGNWNATGTWEEGAVPTNADDVVAQGDGSSGNVTITAAAVCKSAVFTNYTGTLTHNAGVTWTISGNLTLVAGMAYTCGSATTSQITLDAASNITTGGKVLGTLWMNKSGGAFQLQDGLTLTGDFRLVSGTFDANTQTVTMTGVLQTIWAITLVNLTRTGAADATCRLTLAGNVTLSGTFTANGNSAANRLHIQSSAIGTARTINAATVSVTNASFEDITGAGAGSWDLSAITGGSGDGGGNSGITFTTADDYYWHQGTGNWSDPTKWFTATNGGGDAATHPPLLQDTAHFDVNSFDAASTVTVDVNRIGSVDFNGSSGGTFKTNVYSSYFYGSLNFTDLATLNAIGEMHFAGHGADTLTMAGRSWTNHIYVDKPPTGSLTFLDAFAITGGKLLYKNSGILDFGNNSVTINSTFQQGAGSVVLGTGTVTVSNFTVSGGTVTSTGSTIKMIATAASTFAGGGKTYNNLWYSPGAGTGGLTITGANTFADFKDDGSAAHTITFPNSTTTVTTFTHDSTALLTLQRTGASGTFTLAKAGGGEINVDYISVSNSAATPAATWNAGSNSVNGENNTGWVWPSSGGSAKILLGVGR